ncbi:alpha beta-hydrolase [Trichoderma arundinaceum]|uniref:Alpha beta-hydrolase n=1 Tax=Trichoderma arundinaceum TaxID=490622 RepID=A0A395NUN5_TRIAR|nr:alpha beta-hydrolase [Trichoderma arundinaceum]
MPTAPHPQQAKYLRPIQDAIDPPKLVTLMPLADGCENAIVRRLNGVNGDRFPTAGARCNRLKKDCNAQVLSRQPKISRVVQVAQIDKKLDRLISILGASHQLPLNVAELASGSGIIPNASYGASPPAAGSSESTTKSISMRPDYQYACPSEAAVLMSSSIVDQILKNDQANKLMEFYRNALAFHTPFILIPGEKTAQDLYNDSPFLLRAILFSASYDNPSQQHYLEKDIMKYISDHLILKGERSIDLLQGLLVYITWSGPFQVALLLQLALATLNDLGLSRASPARESQDTLLDEIKYPEQCAPKLDPFSYASCRMILGCFYLSSSKALREYESALPMTLRQDTLVHFGQLRRALLVMARLCVFEAEDWDASQARQAVNMPSVVDEMIYRMESAVVALDGKEMLPCPFTRSVESLKLGKAWYEAEIRKPSAVGDLNTHAYGAVGSQYYNFSNIRYGAPPVGDLRFTLPVLPTTRDRKLNLGRQGVICPQASPSPVYVNIFGGGFVAGDKNSQGDPAGILASSDDDMIYVTFNYRLGLYGFLSGHEVAANGTANAGLYDQELALHWVQKYIHLFGGDKDQVTIVGESAGGSSVMHHITSYGGLKEGVSFQRAIAQSPGFHPVPGNAQQEAMYAKTLASASQITGKNITSLSGLRGLSEADLYYTNCLVVAISIYGLFSYGPVVDGKFVPQLPGELLLTGQFNKKLQVMVGHSADEGLVFSSPYIQNNGDFGDHLRSVFPSTRQEVIDYMSGVLYPPTFDGVLGYTNQLQRVDLIFSEFAFACNTRYLDVAFKNQTYSYIFNIWPALHGQDNPYLYFPSSALMLDNGAVNSTLAKIFQGYITNFVKTGNPNRGKLPFWTQYGSNSSVLNMNVDGFLPAKDTMANERCAWWQQALYY